MINNTNNTAIKKFQHLIHRLYAKSENNPPAPSAVRVGWILNGTIETASSRILGYNVHEYLFRNNFFSKIFHEPKARITSILRMSREQINEMFDHHLNILVIVKIYMGDNLDYLLNECKAKNIKVIYAVCDLPDPKMLEQADAIIATSQYFYQATPSQYHHKLHVVFDGYEQPPELFKQHKPEKKIKLCLVTGRAWDEVPCLEDIPQNVSLKIIGPNKSILESVHKNSLVFEKSKFDFTYVPWDLNTVYQEILDCDVGIIPWSEVREEEKIKSANRLIMLMAMGLPVIVTPIPSYLEIIQDKKNGLIAQTPQDWQDHITLLRDDPQWRGKVGKRARETVLNKYSKEKQSALYCSIFKNILNAPQAAS